MDTSSDLAHVIVVMSYIDASSDVAHATVVTSYMDTSSDVANATVVMSYMVACEFTFVMLFCISTQIYYMYFLNRF